MKPIVFSQDSIRAIIEGRKTMTRRVVKTTAVKLYRGTGGLCGFFEDRPIGDKVNLIKPPYQPGDILWVKETVFQAITGETYPSGEFVSNWCTNGPFEYLADGVEKPHWHDESQKVWMCKRSSRYMPKVAARIFLRVNDVLRAEQVQEIMNYEPGPNNPIVQEGVDYGCDFIALWDRINSKRGYGWDKNPWVWVIKFEQITKEDAMKEAI